MEDGKVIKKNLNTFNYLSFLLSATNESISGNRARSRKGKEHFTHVYDFQEAKYKIYESPFFHLSPKKEEKSMRQ